MSDYLVNRTRRDRPGGPPEDLQAELLGRNRAQLSWRPPRKPFAPIDSYEVSYGFRDFRGDDLSNTVAVVGTSTELRDLTFNAKYSEIPITWIAPRRKVMTNSAFFLA